MSKEMEYDKIRAYDDFMDKWDEYSDRRQELYGDSADYAHELADFVVRLWDSGMFDRIDHTTMNELEYLIDKYREARGVLDNAQQRLDDLGTVTSWSNWNDILCAKHPNIKKTFKSHKKHDEGILGK